MMKTGPAPRIRPVLRSRLLLCTAMLSVAQALTLQAMAGSAAPDALPTGGQVQSGVASITTSGAVMNVQQTTDKAIISWQQFNVGSGAYVHFQQPDAQSMTLNRVRGAGQSFIDGMITAPGTVILVNPNGVVFGSGATVDVGGLVASTLDIANEDFEKGHLAFGRGGSDGAIVNEGSLKARGGSVVLLASQITNRGLIRAELGSVILAAGETVTLTPDGGVPLKVEASLLRAEIEAGGIIQSTGGAIYLTAEALNRVNAGVIKATGVMEATGLSSKGGQLVLEGSGPITLQGATLTASGAAGGGTVLVGRADTASVTMDAQSRIDASATDTGKGGTVIVNSEDTHVQGVLLARGGALWGDGGFVETSGHELAFDGVRVDVGAPKGKGGSWLLDPFDLTVNAAYAAAIQSALAMGSVTLQTTNTSVTSTGVAAGGTTNASGNGDIFINSGITWTSANSLTLDAYRGVTVNAAMSGSSLSVVTNNGGTGGRFAANAPVDLTTGLDINGTAYTMITSAADLAAISATGSYALASNLTLSGAWTPIGFNSTGANATPTFAFGGTLEGLGHTISGLTLSQAGWSNIGLFSSVGSTGSLANLVLTGATISGGVPTSATTAWGFLSGRMSGTVFNSSVNGTISGSRLVGLGGLVGVLNGGTILNSNATITSANGSGISAMGGLAGQATANSYISDSYANISFVLGVSNVRVGGVAGDANVLTVLNSYSTGTITATTSTSSLTQYIGGLVGINTNGTIANANSAVNIGLQNASTRIGGLVGSSSGLITNSYATGNITLGGTGNQYVGGLVGVNSQTTATVVSARVFNSYATGDIAVGNPAATVASAQYVGGLAGHMQNGIVSGSFASGTVSVGRSATYVGGLVGSAEAFNLTSSSVLGSFATGQVIGGSVSSNVGGLMGRVFGSILIGAYSTGSVTAGVGSTAVGGLIGQVATSGTVLATVANVWSSSPVTAATGVSVGGLVGLMASSTVLNAYWDTSSSGQLNAYGTSSGGSFSATGFSGAAAFASATYSSFDFTSVWYQIEGATRPFLRAQNWTTIANAHQLQAIAINPSGTYVLGKNITMAELASASSLWNMATGFVPLSLSGSLDGNGYTISGLTINQTASGSLGLFSTIASTGSVSNLALTGASVSGGGNNLGLLAGVNQGTVSGVMASGTVTALGSSISYVGGLIGSNSGTISASLVTATVNASNRLSFAGLLLGHNSATGQVLSSGAVGSLLGGNSVLVVGGLVGLNAGNVSGSTVLARILVGDNASSVGGLVGTNQGTISSSDTNGTVQAGNGAIQVAGLVGTNSGAVSTSYAIGSISVGSAAMHIGGLLGGNGGTVTNSYASASVQAGNGAEHVGGLVGYNDGTVIHAYALGGVSVNGTGTNVAGFAGTNAGTITNAYAVGSVASGSGSSNVAGFAGFNSSLIATAYWDRSTSGQTVGFGAEDAAFTAIVGFSGTAAFSSATYNSFDFTNSWYLVEGYTRPILRAEYSTTIGNAHQLQLVNLNLSASYTLSRDIDMGEVRRASGVWNTATGFLPIGFSGSGSNATPDSFTGTLDGQGHAINNLYINNTGISNVALFASVGSAGVLTSVGVYEGTVVGGGGNVALLAATNAGTILSAYATGTLSATSAAQYVGGLVGANTGTISVAYATAGVTAGASATAVGGLVGYNTGFISTVFASGEVSAGSGAVGAFVGDNAGTIANIYWDSSTSGQTVGAGGGTGSFAGTDVSGTAAYATATYSGLDLTNTWYMVNGYTRPMLRMEYSKTISNAHQLQLINLDPTAQYQIIADITMSELTRPGSLWSSKGWVPLGFNTANANNSPTFFNGVLNGWGRTISGLTIANADYNNAGLISYIGTTGVVSSLTLSNVSISSAGSNQNIGALAGNNAGTVTNVFVSGALDLGANNNAVGGLLGMNVGRVVNSAANVSLRSGQTASNVGALIGQNIGSLSNVYASGSIVVDLNSSNVGGLVGFNSGGTIVKAYSTASINAAPNGTAIGGLAGNNTGLISATYAANSISALAGTGVAGLVGGGSGSGTVIDSFWDVTKSGLTAGVSNSNISGTVTGLSTSEWFSNGPLAQSVFSSNDWVQGYPYPILKALPYITLTGSGAGTYGQAPGSVSVVSAIDQNGNSITSGISTVGLTWAPASGNTSVGTAVMGGSGATYSGGLYQFAYNGNLTITPAALTITASGVTKTYGTSVSVTAYTASGLVTGDSIASVILTPSGGTDATAGVGTYTIDASGATGTGLSNYSITYANGTLVVDPAALTITATGATKTYGNSINLTGFTSSGLVNGDSLSGVSITSGGSGTLANAGSYSIVASGAVGTGLSNYSITYADGTLVVNPAALVITASGATKTYGNSINLTGFTSSGLLNGDSISAVSLTSGGSGTIATVGSYSIVASGATGTGVSNYSITYADGTLVVNPASLTITASGATKT
ncbi:MBG domain-containing protein, partial [Niveispirillum fermenti]|uniref:two-partner secretion domain-containing protein n=1 Tax=Niveispirillum fermenti TaxID=1233113 RepID=UPI003A84506D